MKCGQLTKRIEIQQLILEEDEESNKMKSWSKFCSAWASIEPLNSKEYFNNQADNAQMLYMIRMWYRKGIAHTMRILWGSRIFEIAAPPINVREKNVELKLLCKEVL